MIVHSVKFDRPVTSAALIRVFGDSAAGASENPVNLTSDSANPSAKTNELDESAVMASLMDDISTGVQDLHRKLDPLVKEMQTLAVRLASMMVTKILGSSDAIKALRIERLADEALTREEPVIAVYVNARYQPDLAAYTATHSQFDSRIAIIADESIEEDECRVEFASHELFSSLEYQMTELQQRLLEVASDAEG